jgi:hypothetical protein
MHKEVMKTPCHVILGLCVANVALGQWTSASYSVRFESSAAATVTPGNLNQTSPTGQPIRFAESISDRASASGFVAQGFLSASVITAARATSIENVGTYELSQAAATVSYFDFITLQPPTPDLMGKTGTLNAGWNLSGSMPWRIDGGGNVEYSAFAKVSLAVSGTGVPNAFGGGEVHGLMGYNTFPPNTPNISNPPPGVVPVSYTFTWGSRFGIQYNLNLQAEASASFGFRDGWYGDVGKRLESSAAGLYGQSLTWGGISSLVDADGNPVTGYTVSSASGFDYAQAAVVPEPPSTALGGGILAGCLALFLRRKKPGCGSL